jgi:hypothetical protein
MARRRTVSLRASDKSPKGGLSDSGRRRINKLTGSNLKPPVTESNPTGRRKARQASFCRRMRHVKGPMEKNGKPTRKALALNRWNC